MKKKVWTGFLCAALCLLLLLPVAQAETRQGVIAREGQEEIIEETLFESWMGFSFWYADEWLDANYDDKDGLFGVVVETLYSDDFMVLSMIPEEDAIEYAEDFGGNIVEMSLGSRVQRDVYRDLEDGRYHFLTLIAENGQYLRAVGEYNQEAAEGNAKFFDRVLDSVAFPLDCLLHAAWGAPSADDSGYTQVILTALEPVTDVKLLWLTWDDLDVSWQAYAPLGSLGAKQSIGVTLGFMGDLPNNGIQYTDEAGVTHAFALDIGDEYGELLFWKLQQ